MPKLPPEVARALYRLRRGQWPFFLPLLLLLVPGMAGRPPLPRKVVVPCPATTPDEAMTDVDAGGAYSRPLPAVKPDNWRKVPCPKSPTRRTVDGYCFSLLAERPPCVDGYESGGECLAPMMASKPVPTSIQR